MPLYLPTFNDATAAANLAVDLRKIAVEGVPKGSALRSGAVRDDVSDGAAALANKALEVLRDMGSAGLADWLLMRLSQEPEDLFASMVQHRFIDALVEAKVVAPAAELDTQDLWVDTGEHAPVAPVASKLGVPWAQKAPVTDLHFSPRVSLPTER